MTLTEIRYLKNKLGGRLDLTAEERRLVEELSCRDMIISCYTYQTDFINSSYKDPYVKELGLDRVKELNDEMMTYLRKRCEITYCTYIDHEGCSYNTLTERVD